MPHGGTHCDAMATGADESYPDSEPHGLLGTTTILKAIGPLVVANTIVRAINL